MTYTYMHRTIVPAKFALRKVIQIVTVVFMLLPAKKGHFHVSACQHLLNDSKFVSICLNLQLLVLTGNVLQSFIPSGLCPTHTHTDIMSM